MNYTAADLSRLTLRGVLFDGYSKKQVDSLLSKIVEDYNEMNNTIHELKCQISTLNETVQHYKVLEESLQHSILVAQHTAEQIKANACDKAKNIIEEAELKAQKIIDDANNEARNIQAKYEQLKSELFTFKTKSEALLQAQMDVLKQMFSE
ncbi:DivIVA family protein [Thermoclostridium stercorarium subsp. stercorarium DSM 8532]|uniref:DivIVA family protein n=3 Tax=Thermoclostridium stercorarium TaxID=1510 RepID=L7VSM6_THES1|nr:DivIVA domain-containing protein [Thermoclostridium stercorarium]AGC68553.1 DivIVA family protein [Thermoclostridium stercorarium subsp. stercorarium DSM 8532]AGI39569.1 cell division initiation protein [Thermoclostridium stercorarium subsp. stercorarium DSM 8532]ANW98903.1 cell division protein DivIVA [Thermoclostridium stercorarium subsp. thermolacticum DSM 2910]ANX01430.1 cell division protein DivIVA [Thermoclostridium stercorarium subsp. leptospartum DSM 9219]UZQ84539.1 DivIVA domain-co